ncbi:MULTISPECIES: hypothetical protein [unclassified Arthrobacter]|uniref:hypothetical protein n=1 Tax=unclassified Arthrobacter TaxID=235627 RepID=UPI002DF8C38C|nr:MULTISPECIES: hypothetical protein [unclassified Arthrobacter]MEC5191211.1 hypothetical protein [Arthrobacter sp. MP_M4]MEC5202550.1 hypothetical protein [Arthrobacter sp. MP_M7]
MGRQDTPGTHGFRPGASGSGAGPGRPADRGATRDSDRHPPRKAPPAPARKPSGASARKPARNPVSPVHRRRRLFVGAALLLVIAIAFGGFAAVASVLNAGQAPSGGQTTAAGQATEPADSPEATPSVSATPTGDGCEQGLVTVTASTDKPAYAAGEKPLLTLKVTNGNRVPCEINMGTSQMEFLISSGADRIFSSTDCQADSTELVKTIAPGQSETATFPWQRNRTVQGCAPIEAKPGSGGASYVFTARLANKTSPRAVFRLN